MIEKNKVVLALVAVLVVGVLVGHNIVGPANPVRQKAATIDYPNPFDVRTDQNPIGSGLSKQGPTLDTKGNIVFNQNEMFQIVSRLMSLNTYNDINKTKIANLGNFGGSGDPSWYHYLLSCNYDDGWLGGSGTFTMNITSPISNMAGSTASGSALGFDFDCLITAEP